MDKLSEGYFSSDYFRELFVGDSGDFEFTADFVSDVVLGVYRRWKARPDSQDKPTLDRLADMTSNMLMKGLNGLDT